MVPHVRRPAVRLVLALTGLTWATQAEQARAQRPTDFSSFVETTTQISGNVYKLEPPVSGNTAALVGDDGALLVDPQYAPMHQRLVDAVKKLSDTPIRF